MCETTSCRRLAVVIIVFGCVVVHRLVMTSAPQVGTGLPTLMEDISDLTAPGVDDRVCRTGNMAIRHQIVQYQRNLETREHEHDFMSKP